MQVVRRFLSLERSLRAENQFKDFATVMEEYVKSGHAEVVPDTDSRKSSDCVFNACCAQRTQHYYKD